MKLNINPIAQLIAHAETRLLAHFSPDSIDMVYHRKRMLAEQAVGGAAASPEFEQAAAIEGLTTSELADLILSKPDNLMIKDNARRLAVVDLRQAKTAADISDVLTKHGVSQLGLISDIRTLT